MKLGDNMAPVEPCGVWNDICPLKARPPKIGDIPRRVAVDEESPGCSSSRSLGQFNEAITSKSMLERSNSCQNERGRSKICEALPVIRDFLKSTVTTKSSEKILQISDKIASKLNNETIERSDDSKIKIITEETFNCTLPIFDKFTKNFGNSKKLEIRQRDLSLRSTKSTDLEDDGASLEDGIPEAIYEVRKDSALYIEERNNDSSKLGLAAADVESRYLGTRECSNPCENLEEAENTKLFKPQARRESSGYFSNLGTFDEDRWISSTMDIGNQQDLIATRELSSRERRRSTTKNRVPITLNQQQPQSIQATMGLPCGQQSAKIQNFVYPSSHIDETSRLSDDCKFIPKSSHVEMPNIKEQRSLELENPINFVPTGSTEIKKHSRDISIDDLTNEISRISFGNSSTSSIDASTKTGTNRVERTSGDLDKDKNGESEDSTKKRFNALDSEDHKSVESSTQFESTTEATNGEKLDEKSIKVPSDIGNDSALRPSQIEIEISDEYDDDDDVVAAISEAKKDQIFTTDSRKPLPKPIKVYQLLSTQSEDRGDGEARIYDRRISLQITERNENESTPETSHISVPTEQRIYACSIDEKQLIHADSVPILKIPGSSDIVDAGTKWRGDTITAGKDKSGVLKLYSSSSGSSLCIDERINLADKATGSMIAGIRPIYPYCPYSPYASPHGSPRTTRRRPLRESRRVSIDCRQGALQLNQYKLLNNIGQGSYGIVKLAYNEEDDTHYAMKILSKKKLMKKAGIFGRIAPGRKGSANPLAKVYREIALLKKLDHPNVVKLVEVLDDPDEDNLYLVFELVERGEVLQLPTDKPLDEETARRYFRDVVMGVEYLHYQRIVHRDIKPSNLLVDSEGRVKVADLGVSAELRAAGELLSGSAGTPAFAAPETTTPGAEYSGTLCDVWSMGVTLYSLVIGKVPWDGAGSIIGVQAAIRTEQLRFPEVPSISEDLNDLVSRMLAKDPIVRINLTEIKEHRWLTNNGSEPFPSETENCRLPVTVTDEEVARVVTRVPKLDTLILIKTMLKQHSFQNPFLARRFVKTIGDTASGGTSKQQSSIGIDGSQNHSSSTGATTNNKTEQFHRAGRSNSAPDSYEWRINGRQMSSDSLLPPVTESSSQEVDVEKR